jgi:hypothetical protein
MNLFQIRHKFDSIITHKCRTTARGGSRRKHGIYKQPKKEEDWMCENDQRIKKQKYTW